MPDTPLGAWLAAAKLPAALVPPAEAWLKGDLAAADAEGLADALDLKPLERKRLVRTQPR